MDASEASHVLPRVMFLYRVIGWKTEIDDLIASGHTEVGEESHLMVLPRAFQLRVSQKVRSIPLNF